MTDIIELSSDSDENHPAEESPPAHEVEKCPTDSRPVHYMSDDDDFNFPEVPFAINKCPVVPKPGRVIFGVDEDDDLDLPAVPFASRKNAPKSRLTSPKRGGNSDRNFEDDLLDKYSSGSTGPTISNSGSALEDILFDKYTSKKSTSKPAGEQSPPRKAANRKDHDREKSKAEKQKDREEAAKTRTEKAAAMERLKQMMPGECTKYVRTTLDLTMTRLPFFGDLIVQLQTSGLKYDLESQIVPNSVSWTRNGLDSCDIDPSAENHVILIWDCNQTVEAISDGTFVESVSRSQAMLANKSITLVIYGIEEYFRYHKNQKKAATKSRYPNKGKSTSKSKDQKLFGHLPVVSRKELEICLTEIQITMGCNSRLIDTPQDLSLLINQYAKAIAEAPYKMQKRKIMESDEVDWYAAGDNRDTVRVDKDGNGLERLWQQQLCQFNLVQLETAEAIISKFPSVVQLIDAYDECSRSEGQKLLQDIPIRRAAGPLTSVRRIGPELSKKIHLMFTSTDGDAVLSND